MSSNDAERPAQSVFRTSSFCAAGECLEVGQQDGLIILRDSTRPHDGLLHYGAGEWRSFLRGIKEGRYDDLSS